MEQRIENNDLILKFNCDLIASKIKDIKNFTLKMIESNKDVDNIVFDMKDVEYIDSIGITFVVSILKNIHIEDKKLKIINASKEIQYLFNLTRLNKFIDIS